ncbi:peptide ABC transporter permease [Enterovirga aerilata]|uniref:Peptide ABC transporter permease n=1 Tax=Enterovirga aerilata TaxID=2730920 RepID=A0A849IDI5_9HYPH|nr:peptide ABC transporter permease [Enterovirga sp. DB1703]NNM74100.1 peptide ABC transporter permease [Enterovirga sp. DB1703]
MARAPSIDPAKDAAALLRRLGFAVLMVILPVVALFSRRGVVLFLPIGVALLVMASVLDWAFRPLRDSAERLSGSAGVLAALFGLSWAALSLLWTPAPAAAAERLLGLYGSLGLGAAAYLSLPDRMRAANLYLIPVGVAVAAIAVIVTAFMFPSLTEAEGEGRSVMRGLSVLALLGWPSIAWLRSRNRDLEAICLVVAVALATLVGPEPAISAAFAAGALAYVVVALAPEAGILLARLIMPGIVLLAPLLPLILAPVSGFLPDPGAFAGALAAWKSLVFAEPARLVTGHGFGAFIQARITGALPPGTPDIALVHLWYDLGAVGALAVAASIWAGLRGAAASYAPLLPGVAGAVTAAFSLACAGVGSGQAWWPASLVVLVIAFVGSQRGQFRTRRPRFRELRV